MGMIALLEKGYDLSSDKSASLTSLSLGILNLVWIYLFDRLANGRISFKEPMTTGQWLLVANITLYMLILLLSLSLLFGFIGIRKALSSDGRNSWVLVALVGMLLGVLPLVVSGLAGKLWFHLLFM